MPRFYKTHIYLYLIFILGKLVNTQTIIPVSNVSTGNYSISASVGILMCVICVVVNASIFTCCCYKSIRRSQIEHQLYQTGIIPSQNEGQMTVYRDTDTNVSPQLGIPVSIQEVSQTIPETPHTIVETSYQSHSILD